MVTVRQLAPDSRREQLCGRLLRRFKTKTNTTYKFIWLQNDRVSKPCEFVYVSSKSEEVSGKNQWIFYIFLFCEAKLFNNCLFIFYNDLQIRSLIVLNRNSLVLSKLFFIFVFKFKYNVTFLCRSS